MSKPEIPGPPDCVVVGFDAGAQPTATLSAAADQAELRGLELAVVTVLRPHIDPAQSIQGSRRDQQQAEATALQDLHRAAVSLRSSHPRLVVTTYCLDESDVTASREPLSSAKLLVIGAHGRYDRQALVLGSVSRLLLTSSQCPVLLVPDRLSAVSLTETGQVPLILVGVSEHPADAAVVAAAYAESTSRGCPVLLLHAYARRQGETPEQARQRAENVLLEYAAQGPSGTHVSTAVVEATPAAALARLAAQAALLVIGGRPGALSGLIRESVSREIMETAPCPVLAVPRNLALAEQT